MSPFVAFISEVWPDIESPDGFELELQKAYPGIDYLGEARRAYQWELTARRKKKVHRRFLTNWLNRCAANLYTRLSRYPNGSSMGIALPYGKGTPEYQKAYEEAQQTATRDRDRTVVYLKNLGAQRTTPPTEARTKIADILKKLDK